VAGDVIVGGSSRMTLISVGDAYDLRPGFVKVETDFGPLWLDEDGSARVAADDEKHFQFTAETITEDMFSDIFQVAKNRYGISGTYFGDADIDASYDNYLNAGDGETDDLDAEDTTPGDEEYVTIREAVKATYTWHHLSDRMCEAVNEQVYEQVRAAVDAL
jgi:hypothetical protein